MDKAPDAFRTISEVADELDVPQHVLRFWETRFAQIKPMKRSGGRRYYRPEDVNLLRGIRHLLYGQGYTIRGVQRILREQGIKAVQNWQNGAIAPVAAAAAEDEIDHEEMLRDAVNEEMTDDFEAGEGEDVGEAPSHELPSAIASFIDAARLHRAPAPPQPTLSESLTEPVRVDERNVAKLRAALDELLECRRLLDAAMKAS
ncbi:MerR family transcriptional regulator [Bradyrhizobium sp. LHD-71]|uniref:MerR family transcriptional regulator n=1 Tax=Bradyrhizobium sp. LHD-71 TaxID=3072141 RepID=UPI00280C5683|nr:MerR family transcriptional regulator [Bradyrhizobium sp. LHD-71]MDQ8726133.1 MerR family transcriptional regulator [Bradyrhizobium sp. LHD-71]